jgi:8-oxo-dGTP pyrophosphatase MutT (NUDIX family)
MNFTFFSQQISKIENLPLPGEASHFKMAPESRIKELKAQHADRRNAKKAGVMALFYPDQFEQTHLLLILRKTYKGVHSNQVAFPGGKEELEDEDIRQTALRETHEEVGVKPAAIQVIKALSTVYIPPSNFEVYPFVGVYNDPKPFVIQEDEVENIIEVTLTDFLDDALVFEQSLSTSYAENIHVPAFKLNDYTVWGATAMMLSEIKELLKQVL